MDKTDLRNLLVENKQFLEDLVKREKEIIERLDFLFRGHEAHSKAILHIIESLNHENSK